MASSLPPASASSPVVSVVIAARDGEAYIRDAIESVLEQDGVDLEVVVVDDGSEDGTPQSVRELAASDGRVRLISADVASAGAARNIGWRAARGRFVAILDQDDLALPGRLAAQAAYLERHPQVGLVAGFCEVIDGNGDVIGNIGSLVEPAEMADALLRDCPVVHCTAMFRREVLEAMGGYLPIPGTACEDYDLALRLSERSEIHVLRRPLAAWRVHGGNASQDIERMTRWVLYVRGLARLRRRAALPVAPTALPAWAPSDEELAAVGVTRSELDAELASVHLRWAGLHTDARNAVAARGHLLAARAILWRQGPAERATYLSECAWTQARSGHRASALRLALLALLAAPGTASSSLGRRVVVATGRAAYRRLPGRDRAAVRRVRDRVVRRLTRP